MLDGRVGRRAEVTGRVPDDLDLLAEGAQSLLVVAHRAMPGASTVPPLNAQGRSLELVSRERFAPQDNSATLPCRRRRKGATSLY